MPSPEVRGSFSTVGSLAWPFTAPVQIEPHAPLNWLRIALLLPGVISLIIGQALFESHLAPDEVGIFVGAIVAVTITCGTALTIARRP